MFPDWLLDLVKILLGGGLGALVMTWVKVRKGLSEVAQKERGNVEDEWNRHVARLNAEIERLDEYGRLQSEKMDRLSAVLDLNRNEHAECRAQLLLLTWRLNQYTGSTGETPPPTDKPRPGGSS